MEYIRSYSEASKLQSYLERLNYFILGDNNVSSPRDISNEFYKSDVWLKTRHNIITRDFGCDLGITKLYIEGPVLVHHINPIDRYDIINMTDKLLDPDNLICTSLKTHNKIHYAKKQNGNYVERRKGDTLLWESMTDLKSMTP